MPSTGACSAARRCNRSSACKTPLRVTLRWPREGAPRLGACCVECNAADAKHALRDARARSDWWRSCGQSHPACMVQHGVERTATDARIADADEVAVGLQMEAAREHGHHARGRVSLDKALGMRAQDRNRRHWMHCKAIAAAAAFDGATITPACVSLRTWAERTCGSASVPVTEATMAGPSAGRAPRHARQMARRVRDARPSPGRHRAGRRRRSVGQGLGSGASRVAGSIIGCGRPRVNSSSPRSIMTCASRIARRARNCAGHRHVGHHRQPRRCRMSCASRAQRAAAEQAAHQPAAVPGFGSAPRYGVELAPEHALGRLLQRRRRACALAGSRAVGGAAEEADRERLGALARRDRAPAWRPAAPAAWRSGRHAGSPGRDRGDRSPSAS